MAATEETLGQIHEITAKLHLRRLQALLLKEDILEERTADRVLDGADRFLKANSITCAPSDDNSIGELTKKVEAQREKRKTKLTLVEQSDALQDMQGFGGI